jgi:aryl-alcohol dehydrogenase-like predicted oxidoreductase
VQHYSWQAIAEVAEMEQRPLGTTGLEVSTLGFGGGAFAGLLVRGSDRQQVEAVGRAIDGGVTYFDTAAQYGDGRSEESLGRALAELGATSKVTIGTKVRLSKEQLADPAQTIRASLQDSLRRLRREMVDVFFLHNFPRGSLERNGVTLDHLESIAEAMRDVQQEGLVRSIGLTGVGETAAVRSALESRLFDSIQCYFNVLNASAVYSGATGGGQDFDGLVPRAASLGTGSMSIRTLAGGSLVANDYRALLAGPVGDGTGLGGSAYDDDVGRAQKLIPLAESTGCDSVSEFGLRFVLSHSDIATAVVGFSDVEQVEVALSWAERGALPEEAITEAVRFARSTPVPLP